MSKDTQRKWIVPLIPLLRQFRAHTTHTTPDALQPLHFSLFDSAADDVLVTELRRFAQRALPVCWHPEVFSREIAFLRHALAHLYRGQDPLPDRLSRCVTPGAAYHLPGLGRGFWSAAVRSLDPERLPYWSDATERGLAALGLFPEHPRDAGEAFSALLAGCEKLRAIAPELSGVSVSHFLASVARIDGRELASTPCDSEAFAWAVRPVEIQQAVREVRTHVPLKQRFRQSPPEVNDNISRFQLESAAGNYEAGFTAFHNAFPDLGWETALPRIDDAYSVALSIADRGRLLSDIATVLRHTFHVHPLELADVLVTAGQVVTERHCSEFRGFCSDTFAFLAELTGTNTREWMCSNRERYQFVLREPLVELCEAVANRYIQPVLNREYKWDLECDARTGRALTSICKNDYGRGAPYQPVQWVTFYRRSQANKRADAQFFVRVATDGIRYGFHLGRSARVAGGQFRKALQEHGEVVFRALAPGQLLEGCRFWVGEDLATEVIVKCPADLRAWATNKTIAAGIHRSSSDPVLRGEDLPGEVLLTFDRLLPLFACAAESDPRPLLTRRAGSPDRPPPYDPVAFHRETFLSEVWLDRVLGLLRLKKQLILQGVPGTGKTHVARCLARLLTHDRPGCVRLVQFHPAYSYEEFVEGIRVRNVETDGRSEVSYPVEDGVLCEFAQQAALRPGEPHVLIVDELNRGNLPRIFGELLFLLEYRAQAVTLPYSKRAFRLPENLFVLATMNQLDRSAVMLDQAVRRRFSFVDMPADAAVLAKWLEEHPPTVAEETFGVRVVRLFEELNIRLARDLGADRQVGHSFFMVPELDREKLAAVWEHHVRPLLLDYLGGRTERLNDYTPERLLAERPARRAKPVSDA
jgi:MoxR-like ATPase